MICPDCGTEHRTGVDSCGVCGRRLPGSSGDALDRSQDLVPVLTTTDPTLLPVAKSVLEAAGIPHVVQGEAGISVFPLGPAAARATNRVTGAMILVTRSHFEEARALLEVRDEPDADEADD